MWLDMSLICGFLSTFLYGDVVSAVSVRGKGASFPYEVYKDWMPAYRAYRSPHVRVEMTYDAIGSGGGQRAIKGNVDIEYAGSDSKLSDPEDYPDLVMFPIMAGAVMIGYNIPDLNGRLILSVPQIVGIYNGTYTWWNDTEFTNNNPDITLPKQRIIVIARADKSGTTSLFTEGLAAVSPEWQTSYGVFSKGFNSDTDLPYHWNPDVINYYGQQNRGMSGLILSFKYSIGYLSVADALEANIESAIIINKAGNPVNASSASVQSAMDSFSLTNSNLTFSLANAASDDAYPIAGFTHLIMYKTQMKNCQSAKELVRYIYWVMTEDETRKTCDRLGMAALSSNMVQRVTSFVLKRITCNNQNVWAMVQADIAEENKQEQAWIIPVSVTIPIVALAIFCLCLYIFIQRLKLKKMIDNDEWHIPIEDIVFFFDGRHRSSNTSRLVDRLSILSNASVRDIEDEEFLIKQIIQWPGKYCGSQIGIRLIDYKELKFLTRDTRHQLLSMKRKISHNNVVRFFGLTELDNFKYAVGDYCSKGQISNLLKDNKFNLSYDLKCTLAADIANGMFYLHSNDLIHGNLRSEVCLIDARWQVKICDWEYCRLLSLQSQTVSPLLAMRNKINQNLGTQEMAFQNFWVCPEMLRADFKLAPSKDVDVYSYAIILQEIFSREDPYVEHADTMKPTEVIKAITLNNLRPEHNEDTPVHIRQLMEICWNDNPVSRPSFDQVLKLLKRANPVKKTVIDSMMATLEDYIGHLEERIEEKNAELKVVNNKLETTLSGLMPVHIAKNISQGMSVHPVHYSSLAIAVLEISLSSGNFSEMSPRDVISFISELCFEIDVIAKTYSVFTESLRGSSLALVYGLDSNNIKLGYMCSSMVNLCLDVLAHEDILKLNTFSDHGFHLRFGVHTGPAVSGLSGTNTPRYVVFGNCTDVAQALARSASSGCLHSTRGVWKAIKHEKEFKGVLNGELTVKGETYTTYMISRWQDKIKYATSEDSGVGGEPQNQKLIPEISKQVVESVSTPEKEIQIKTVNPGTYQDNGDTHQHQNKHISQAAIDNSHLKISSDNRSKRRRSSRANKHPYHTKHTSKTYNHLNRAEIKEEVIEELMGTFEIPVSKEYVPVRSKWKRKFCVNNIYPSD